MQSNEETPGTDIQFVPADSVESSMWSICLVVVCMYVWLQKNSLVIDSREPPPPLPTKQNKHIPHLETISFSGYFSLELHYQQHQPFYFSSSPYYQVTSTTLPSVNMADTEEMSSQADGAAVPNAGSGLETTTEFDVEVTLINPNSPLYSVHTFEELKL